MLYRITITWNIMLLLLIESENHRNNQKWNYWLYFYLSSCPHRFLIIIHVARNYVQRMRPQATGSNNLRCSIIFPSARPVLREHFAIFVFVSISSVGVHCRDEFIPTLGYEGSQKGPFKLIYLSFLMYLCLFVSLSLCPVVHISFCQSFVWTVITGSACGQILGGKIPWMEVYYVRLSICLSVGLFRFLYLYKFSLSSSSAYMHLLYIICGWILSNQEHAIYNPIQFFFNPYLNGIIKWFVPWYPFGRIG